MANPLNPSTIVSYNYLDQNSQLQKSDQNSEDATFHWGWVEVILAIILGSVVVGTILGNLFVLVHFTKRLRVQGFHDTTPTHFFIANLALADWLVGVLVLPYLASLQVTGNWYFGQCFCTIWVCTHFWLCAASILSTCAICIERYIGVKYPIQHMRILTPNRIGIALICVWVFAGVPSLVRVFAWTEPKIDIPYKCTINQKLGHAILAAGGIFYIPASIMMLLYYRIYRIAMRHMNSRKTGVGCSRGLTYQVSIGTSSTTILNSSATSETMSHPTQNSNSDGVSNNKDLMLEFTEKGTENLSSKNSPPPVRHIRHKSSSIEQRQIILAKKLAVLVGVVLVSYGPYFTLILWKSINDNWVNHNAFDCFAWIRYFNSFLNPLIYAYAVPTFNTAFKKSFIGSLTINRGK